MIRLYATLGRVSAAAALLLPLPRGALEPGAAPRWADGGGGLLSVVVFTDTLPGRQAMRFRALAGDSVRRTYVVENEGFGRLEGVVVHDPDTGSVTCAARHSRRTGLSGFSIAVCTATFPAKTGSHPETVTVAATVPAGLRSDEPHAVSGEAEAGYTATTASLKLTVSLDGHGAGEVDTVPVGRAVAVSYSVVNDGDEPVRALSLADVLPVSALRCPSNSASSSISNGSSGNGGNSRHAFGATPPIDMLRPGASTTCSASLRALPGRHVGRSTVNGIWCWTRAVTAAGPQPARFVGISATSGTIAYVGIVPPPTPPTPPPSPKPQPSVASPRPPASPSPQTPSPQTPAPQTVSSHAPPSSSPASPTPPSPSARPAQSISAGGSPPPSGRIGLLLTSLIVVIAPAIIAARRLSATRRR